MQHSITVLVSTPSYVPAEHLELEDAFIVNYSRLPLDPESFEEKCIEVEDFLEFDQHEPEHWTKIAYFSKRSDVVVFVKDNSLTIINHYSEDYYL